MKWREVDIGHRGDDTPRPSLSKILEHYNWKFSPSKGRQMISCLFHEDRTPSMSIDLTSGVFNCHSCGKGGDAYRLLMEKEGISFTEAREFARERFESVQVGQREVSSRWRKGVSSEQRAKVGTTYTPSWRRSR